MCDTHHLRRPTIIAGLGLLLMICPFGAQAQDDTDASREATKIRDAADDADSAADGDGGEETRSGGDDLARAPSRPAIGVREGIYDKPYLFEGFGTRVGGYGDVHFRVERVDGATEELTFLPKRFNLFTFTRLGERVRVALELEIEEAGEEIKLELGIIDFEIHPALTFRGGIILTPLGRFNLAHDSPANELTDRPLVSTELLGVTLSEVGMGFYGEFHPSPESRITYEIYAVNGFTDGVIVESDEGTRIPAGKDNFEDTDNVPAGTARVSFSPHPIIEMGVSGHVGPYNRVEADGIEFDERRLLGIFAVDWDIRWWIFEFLGEYAFLDVDVPASLDGLFAEQQQGFYAELDTRFLEGVITALPESVFTFALRVGAVDFDMATEGDARVRVTAGLNFRPRSETVFKLDYQYTWNFDPLDVLVPESAVLFSVASYF